MVDEDTHVYVRFMVTKYNLGVVDMDTMSIIFFINKILSRVWKRHIKRG